MITYTLQKINYCELVGLSKDRKPLNGEVGNGSLFTEMDPGKEYRYDAETNCWICAGDPYPPVSEEKKTTAKKKTPAKAAESK